MIGYGHPDIQGRSIHEISFWKGTGVLEDLRKRLDSGRELRNVEVRLRTHQGPTMDGLLSAEPVVIQDEPCVLCVVQDITERKRSEVDVIRAIETVMKDTSWFSHTVMEKLAQTRRHVIPAPTAANWPRSRHASGKFSN